MKSEFDGAFANCTREKIKELSSAKEKIGQLEATIRKHDDATKVRKVCRFGSVDRYFFFSVSDLGISGKRAPTVASQFDRSNSLSLGYFVIVLHI